jgi:hypothetical protein
VSENGQIDLRGEEFSALIHGLEVRSKKNWYRRQNNLKNLSPT